ncbi:hypothetical protein F5B19DRAFT_389680 [Rostrohypoxylon terebratum]|nr:hypothetical protein F5B19DRAFT_389680 [Rostrohypoxylon terebratum]
MRHSSSTMSLKLISSLSALVAVTAVPKLAAADSSDTIGASINSDGVTELFGDSFGDPGTDAEYDYVIVGGGTAGNVLAARLALASANYTVAVIEAGNFYEVLSGNKTQIPGHNFEEANPTNVGSSQLMTQTLHAIKTAPIQGYNGRSLGYTTGMTFGGGTAANYAGYARSTIGAHNHWADLVGDDFWSWDNVYPFYKKSVNFSPPDFTRIESSLNITYDASAYESTGGPLHVSYGNFQGPYGPPLAEALEGQGLDNIQGFSSGKLIGYGTIAAAVDPKTATRSSSETSFLQAAAGGTGLKIYPNTLAKRVVFNGTKATGVEVRANSLTQDFSYTLSARKEVIVSAGVWRSPQVLMVSGVGPADTLAAHGIDVVVDLPAVGQNAWDHPFLAHIYKVNVETNSQIVAGNMEAVLEAEELYRDHQMGRLSSIGTGQAVSFEKYPEAVRNDVLSQETKDFLSTFPDDWPEANYLPLESSAVPADIGPDDYYLLYGSTLFATSARGNMTISSNNTADDPIINPNWLGEESDVEMAVASFTRLREIAFNSSIVESTYSPPANVTTREQIVDWIRENSALTYHGACTCKMGADNDTNAVVDTRARVRGTTNLRVVDASSFAIMPPGYPMAMVYMFAEKIADAILNDA